MKVDIHYKEPEDYIWELSWNSYQDPEEELWNKVRENFRFELSYSIKEQRQEKEDRFFNGLKEELDDYIKYKRASDQKCLDEIIESYKKGWRFHQQIDSKYSKYKYNFYAWKILNEKGKNEGANWATTGPILLSGQFESHESEFEGYIEWKLKS